ncbi:MAG: type II secretion system minor pseudopilin GspK [Candidatus Competibacterales bacterium]
MKRCPQTRLARRRTPGAALVAVLWAVFLATSLGVALAVNQQRAINRSAVLLQGQQAGYYALGAEAWAVEVLKEDDGRVDHQDEDWAILPPAIPVPGGQVTGRLHDLQGRFNLNNLNPPGAAAADPPGDPQFWYRALERLLNHLELDPQLAQAIGDWVDNDGERRFPAGAEGPDYTLADPPYRPADGPLVSIAELRAVAGMTPAAYRRLAPYVSALPEATHLNINSASAPVLAAVLAVSVDTAAAWIARERPVDAVDQLTDYLPEESGPAQLLDALGVASDFFALEATAQIGAGRVQLQSLIQRRELGGLAAIAVLSRRLGGDG